MIRTGAHECLIGAGRGAFVTATTINGGLRLVSSYTVKAPTAAE